MSDFDYGREKGFWGNDGIPYWINSKESSSDYSSKKSAPSTKQYNRSEQLARQNGFKEVQDENAYNGRYFVKDGKLWIHNIGALKATLGIKSDNELKKHGYDVDAYYQYKN